MLAKLRPRHRGADPKTAVDGRDFAQARDPLEVDDQIRLDHPRTQLHQQVRAAGQRPGQARFALQQRHRRIECFRRLVSHVCESQPNTLSRPVSPGGRLRS